MSRETFALPMMRRFTEYSASIVRMPESSAGIFRIVWKKPVARPAQRPPQNARISVRYGFIPFEMQMAEIAAPMVRLPSTVISAISRIL